MQENVPIKCERCQEMVGGLISHLVPFPGITVILVDPTWCSHLCGKEVGGGRADGDVCAGCGGVCGEPEPSDLDHPYYKCADCAGGA
jgi:hypothetical protein